MYTIKARNWCFSHLTIHPYVVYCIRARVPCELVNVLLTVWQHCKFAQTRPVKLQSPALCCVLQETLSDVMDRAPIGVHLAFVGYSYTATRWAYIHAKVLLCIRHCGIYQTSGINVESSWILFKWSFFYSQTGAIDRSQAIMMQIDHRRLSLCESLYSPEKLVGGCYCSFECTPVRNYVIILTLYQIWIKSHLHCFWGNDHMIQITENIIHCTQWYAVMIWQKINPEFFL